MSEDLLVLNSVLKMPMMELPVKTTLVKVQGGLIMISPLPDIIQFKEQIEKFGAVTDIVAPNLFHNMGLADAQKIFPRAKLWGVQGIEQKAPNLNWHAMIDSNNWPYNNELEACFVAGMPKFNEVDFIHHPTKTLIVADLCFNLVKGRGVGNWVMSHLFGTYKRFGVSKLFTMLIKDRKECIKSLSQIVERDFDNIIIPHGENLEGHARKRLKEALQERRLT